jgi:uncharacterized protein (TIGR03435 family)
MQRPFPLAIFIAFCLIVLTSLNGFSQVQAAPARVEFDAASVKPSASARLRGTMLRDGKLTTTGITLKTLMALAYSVRESEISGGPNWVGSEKYDINAKAAGPTNTTDLKLMVRALIEDRFQLRTHREMKEMPVYALATDKRGPILKASDDLNCTDPASGYTPPPQLPAPGQPFKPVSIRCGNFYVLNDRLQGRKVTLQQLASTLSSMNIVERRVVDQTGIAGTFDIDLHWNPSETVPSATDASSADANLPPIFEAFREQLGLKLQAQTAAVEVLVIDNASVPSAN